MPRDGSEPRAAMMAAAEMRMTEAMTTEVTTEVTAAVMPAPVTTTVAATMTTTVATAPLRQSPTCEQASQGQRGDSKSWSQHLTLP